jgi:hypothetical protein
MALAVYAALRAPRGFFLLVAIGAYFVEIAVAIPIGARLARHSPGPRWIPIGLTTLGSTAVTQLFGVLPAVHLPGLGVRSSLFADIATAACVFVLVGVCRTAILEHTTTAVGRPAGHPWRWWALAGGGVALCAVLNAVDPELTIYWRSASRIESFLRERTPLGTSESRVQAQLAALGARSELVRRHIPANSDYPRSSTGGEAAIHTMVAAYRAVFTTSVEVFYIFDGAGLLVDIKARKTVDSL